MASDTVLILGGDQRQLVLAELLKEKAYRPGVFGLKKKDQTPAEGEVHALHKAIFQSRYIFLPLPYRDEDGYIRTPFTDSRYRLMHIIKYIPQKAVVFLGGADQEAKDLFKTHNIQYDDLFDDEAFLIKNARITAEGAMKIALDNIRKCLYESAVMVCGYGRIGKALSALLAPFCPEVIVTARKYTDAQHILLDGNTFVHTEKIADAIASADIVFNTIPARVIGEKELKHMRADSCIIELASAPYGVDTGKARELNRRIIPAPGLPGRMFPVSAANAIFESFERYLLDGESYGSNA